MPTTDPAQLSVQLYTLRGALQDAFAPTLESLAGIGFRQVEPFGLIDFADQLAELLPRYGLTAPTAHVSLIGADPAAAFAAAAKVGVATVIEPMVDPERWTAVDGIVGVAEELNAVAHQAAEHGLRVGYHNHWFEVQTDFDGRTGLDVFAAHLAPEVVLEVDTYWVVVGGADVTAQLQRLGDRVVALHVKDGDGTRDTKQQVAAGRGALPIPAILTASPDALRVVELDDTTGDVLEAVRDSYAYLTSGDAA